MTAYYNEIDPYAAQWLRNLINGGHIARGDVDERSIRDVRGHELRGYTQAHFFAGIGGWSVALRLAGWPDDRPVWTGSCPCQPFSAAGSGKAFDDDRHLWPAWIPLIAQCRPPIVFGEQVEAAVGWGWLDTVFFDLEAEGYAVGAAVLPACSVGAPHIRQRTWFVADTDGGHASTEGLQRGGEHGQRAQDGGAGALADTDNDRQRSSGGGVRNERNDSGRSGPLGDLADTAGGGFRELGHASQPRSGGHDDRGGELGIMGDALRAERRTPPEGRAHVEYGADARRQEAPSGQRLAGAIGHFWSDAQWLPCTDGKSRPVGPGSFPLGHGIRNRTSKLRAYGNAIVPQTAAEFIRAASGCMIS